jgi:hypothetical protein
LSRGVRDCRVGPRGKARTGERNLSYAKIALFCRSDGGACAKWRKGGEVMCGFRHFPRGAPIQNAE